VDDLVPVRRSRPSCSIAFGSIEFLQPPKGCTHQLAIMSPAELEAERKAKMLLAKRQVSGKLGQDQVATCPGTKSMEGKAVGSLAG
jgi:hypothetical protein